MMRVGVGPVLKRSLAAELGLKADLKAKSATGLTRPDVYDWPKQTGEIFSRQAYDVAVVMIGANDGQNISEDGMILEFGTAAWRESYKRRLRSFLAILCDHVREAHWLGLPPMRNRKLNGRITELTAIIESEVRAAKCGRYLPTAGILGEGGAYAASRKIKRRRLNLREADGVHITQHGGNLIWGELKPHLQATLTAPRK